MIPVCACGSIAWMSASSQFIVFTLDNEFRLRKGIVIARVVHVEMSTYEEIDIVRIQTKNVKMLKYIFFAEWQRRLDSRYSLKAEGGRQAQQEQEYGSTNPAPGSDA